MPGAQAPEPIAMPALSHHGDNRLAMGISANSALDRKGLTTLPPHRSATRFAFWPIAGFVTFSRASGARRFDNEGNMASNPTQDNQTGKLATPLGKDVLLLGRFDGAEGMGELFEFRIEALSPRSDIRFDDALGRNSSVHLGTSDGVGRDFSGVVTEARRLGKRGDLFVYNLVLRPWLWLLSLTSDCKIFANMDPKAIIKQVFDDRHFSDVIDLTAQDYPTLEYTVQYRETDLNFVLRLMEEYGIYYYFQFMPGDGDSPSIHYLVLADSTTHVKLPSPTEVVYVPSTVSARSDVQQFNDWTKGETMVSGVFALNDYDYEKPGATLLASAQYGYQFQHGDMEIYNYPGGYNDQDEGVKLAEVCRDAMLSRNQRCTGAGYAPTLTPGFTIKRTSTDGDPEDGEYLLLRCVHSYGYQSYESESSAAGGSVYYGTYELAKSDITYRMPLQTRKPVVVGSQSALVVGKQGEEIDVDDQGRICVQFYWDRKKKPSRRVRVAHFWAGEHRGALFVPRIGDEVMVAYDDGDPDRPLVVGSVYNGANKITLDLPARKTVSGLLGRSTRNGSTVHTANAWWFDDVVGDEVFVVRARKDLMVRVLNDEKRHVSANQTENVDGNVTQNVGGDETITVGGPTGGGNYTLNAFQTAKINVGPKGSPLTQILMDTSSITLNVGPGGSPTQIVMNASGITLKGPTITINGVALVTASAAMVKINC
jgi:type VI secretion system secreted protein VgrG